VPIQELKGTFEGRMKKDRDLEDALFRVSTQSRDQKNQMTFKVKEQCQQWFDPFSYMSFDKHSEIFKMYEQKKMGKIDGVNDIVGDYQSNYKFATGLNYQLMENMARSQLIQIVVALLRNWLAQRKRDGQEESKSGEEDLFQNGRQRSNSFQEMLSKIVGA